jgi:hypothetical protein
MNTVRAEPFDFAQDRLVEALPPFGPLRTGFDRLVWFFTAFLGRLGDAGVEGAPRRFDRLTMNGTNTLPFVPSLAREACRRACSGFR